MMIQSFALLNYPKGLRVLGLDIDPLDLTAPIHVLNHQNPMSLLWPLLQPSPQSVPAYSARSALRRTAHRRTHAGPPFPLQIAPM